ncbi:TPA: hypothetical protein KUM96_004375 [Serratia marcescens]|nr:hypothetical protein [Serratia marcescens]
MISPDNTLSKQQEPEICRCAVISNAHMTRQDAEILGSLSRHISGEDGGYNWIHPTTYGFLIRTSARTDATAQLRRKDLSDDFCHVVTYLTEQCQVSMIHFDADAELLKGFPVHNW